MTKQLVSSAVRQEVERRDRDRAMQHLHFTKETLPEIVASDIQYLNKLNQQSSRFLSQLNEFASQNGMSPGPLRSIMKSVLLVPNGALKRNLTAEQVRQDFTALGLSEEKTSYFTDQWILHSPVLSRLAVGQTLSVNQLLDMEWKFGVTAGSSELQKVGTIFLQLKLVIKKGNATENVYMELTLPQFYNFLHEMERAKTSLESFS
ncbi:COMM domain-containing protein 7 isoform X2 [Latimeria chalumnae]|uniref:COMM domain-containing protein 7 isoform X2 n=1 Tax=Latimeria chalumnae TaxID=7897 RepID=UPI00313B28AD